MYTRTHILPELFEVPPNALPSPTPTRPCNHYRLVNQVRWSAETSPICRREKWFMWRAIICACTNTFAYACVRRRISGFMLGQIHSTRDGSKHRGIRNYRVKIAEWSLGLEKLRFPLPLTQSSIRVKCFLGSEHVFVSMVLFYSQQIDSCSPSHVRWINDWSWNWVTKWNWRKLLYSLVQFACIDPLKTFRTAVGSRSIRRTVA